MQLKGLVRIFAILLILITIYQLSFTLFVRNYESDVEAKAKTWVKRNNPNIKPSDEEAAIEERKRAVLDSTKNTKIGPFGFTTYKNAKNQELNLGLDLQGGMSVTMEVGLGELIKSLADNTSDANFNKALESALVKKANSDADLVSIFVEEYKATNSSNPLASFFINKSANKIKTSSSEGELKSYLKSKADDAYENTVRIITNRIDKFGVASPSINKNPQKGIVTIELAGVKEPERVRNILVSTANLQFFECYKITDLDAQLQAANKALETYILNTYDSTKRDSTLTKKVKDTLFKTAILAQGQPDQKTGQYNFPSYLMIVPKSQQKIVDEYLKLDVVASKFPPNTRFVYGKNMRDREDKELDLFELYAIKTLDNGLSELEGDRITDARAEPDQFGKNAVSMRMDATGTSIWAKMTQRNVGKPIAIVLDDICYSAPNIINPITEGNSSISGSFTIKEAQDLAQVLESGKLPAPAKIVQFQEVGASLGADAVKGGLMSFGIAFGVIFLLMLVYYNTAGWVANIALILNLLFTVGVLASLGFTLTAAGIAGLVLTIGMAVDTNVIIFERIKEELNRGKSNAVAVQDGYKRSLAPVLDAHVTSFLTAAILFIFGLGPILGFATTQMLGITLSLFCGILVSRLITDMYTDEKKGRKFEYFTGLSKKIFKHASYKFIEYRKIAYIISVVVLIAGVAAIFNGFDEGVEFAGGRSYTVKFDKKTTPEEVKESLKKAFGDKAAIVKTVGVDGKKLNITTEYKIHETGKTVDAEVEQALFTGLQKNLPSGIDFKTFQTVYKESAQTVLPSISADLKAGAFKAGVIAIIIICFYIFIRFRDWRYSVGTIVALLHDVFVTLAVFSFCRSFVPFPLEIDQHFIAAVLTVIGFSMNDTVIVYDRIREDSKLYPNLSKEEVINTAINQTLSRTIMTSLTVFLTILILFIFGGEVTKGFAFAMLVGVITGTYSSIFVAAPILVDFAKNRPLGKSSNEVENKS